MDFIQGVFDNWLMRTSAIVLLLMLVLVLLNIGLNLPDRIPLAGLLTLTLVPILFIVDVVIFAIVILKS